MIDHRRIWIEPAAWLDARGPHVNGLRAPRVVQQGEHELAAALIDDPRRVVAVVGEPGAGTSRLALELARARTEAGAPAFYRDPVAPPTPRADVLALAALLDDVSADVTPVVVLDGPDRREALAPLSELASRRLHPRLRVLVPCDAVTAPDLPRLAGLPRGSILVVVVDRAPSPLPPSPADVPVDRLLPLVLCGRAPAGALAHEGELVALGLAARDAASGTVMCLLDERGRRALAEREVLAHAAGAAQLESLLAREPRLRAAITSSLLAWTRGDLPAALVPVLAAFDGDAPPDLAALARHGVAPPPALIAALETRALALGDAVSSAEMRGALAELRVELARRRRDREAMAAALADAQACAIEPSRRARATVALASMARDRALCERAAAEARATADAAACVEALATLADLIRTGDDPAGARSALEEAAGIAETDGAIGVASAMRASAAAIASEAGDVEGAAALGRRVLSDRRAIGDAQGAVFALQSLARWAVERDARDEAQRSAEESCALADAIGDVRGVGYARWFLGALAERGGDGREAMRQYAASLDAYAELGDVPDRVVASMAALERAYAAPRP